MSRENLDRSVRKIIKTSIFNFYRTAGQHNAFSLMKSCDIPWHSLAVRCDGTVNCYGHDLLGEINLGNINNESLENIWNGRHYIKLRENLIKGIPSATVCIGCQWNIKFSQFRKDNRNPVVPLDELRHLLIEPTILCNLRCLSCNITNAIPLRSPKMMSIKTFCKIIDQAPPAIQSLRLSIGGECFLNPKSYQMAEYAKNRFPEITIKADTNGLLIDTKSKMEAVINCFDKITFSIDGASQETYAHYRRGGDFERAIENLGKLICLKNKMNRNKPKVIWKYILFKWSDTDEEMSRARKIARRLGVDQLLFNTTHRPLYGFSRKFTRLKPHHLSKLNN